MSYWTDLSLNFLPINLLMEKTVDLGLTIICLFATSPTILLIGSTTDGMTLRPSAEWITFGLPPSITATQLLVVPKSIPIIFAIFSLLKNFLIFFVRWTISFWLNFTNYYLCSSNNFITHKICRSDFCHHLIFLFTIYNICAFHDLFVVFFVQTPFPFDIFTF